MAPSPIHAFIGVAVIRKYGPGGRAGRRGTRHVPPPRPLGFSQAMRYSPSWGKIPGCSGTHLYGRHASVAIFFPSGRPYVAVDRPPRVRRNDGRRPGT
jgi:hypothetical protein